MCFNQKIGYPQNPGYHHFPMVQWPFLGIAHFQVDPNLKYHGYSYIYIYYIYISWYFKFVIPIFDIYIYIPKYVFDIIGIY